MFGDFVKYFYCDDLVSWNNNISLFNGRFGFLFIFFSLISFPFINYHSGCNPVEPFFPFSNLVNSAIKERFNPRDFEGNPLAPRLAC